MTPDILEQWEMAGTAHKVDAIIAGYKFCGGAIKRRSEYKFSIEYVWGFIQIVAKIWIWGRLIWMDEQFILIVFM